MKKFFGSFVLMSMLLSISASVTAGTPDSDIHITGASSVPGGVKYVSSEKRAYNEWSPNEKTGVRWWIHLERTNLQTGEVSRALILETGNSYEISGHPIMAFWSVSGGKQLINVIPATEGHDATFETTPAVAMVCAGWGGADGSATGVCVFQYEKGLMNVLVKEGDLASYQHVDGTVEQFTVSNFRSPVVSGADEWKRLGVVFSYADCTDASGNVARCIIGVGNEYVGPEKPVVLFRDGMAENYTIRLIGIQEGTDPLKSVEDLASPTGWTVPFKVEWIEKDGDGNVVSVTMRTATATLTPDDVSVFHISDNPLAITE